MHRQIANLNRFEEFIKMHWDEWSHSMRFVAMQSRRGLIKQLQREQIRTFDREK